MFKMFLLSIVDNALTHTIFFTTFFLGEGRGGGEITATRRLTLSLDLKIPAGGRQNSWLFTKHG